MIFGMKPSVKIAISMPGDLLGQVDRARRRRKETRSQYFREAAAARLATSLTTAAEEYRHGYRDQPETADEVAAANQSAIAILAAEPWD